MLVSVLPGISSALICVRLRHSSCKEILLVRLCSASGELCRLILLSPLPFHLSVTAKWLSPVRHLSSGLSMDRMEEVVRYLTLQCLVNATTTGPQRPPSIPLPLWFRGLNVCVWGQMDTFISAWVWIILQATSGAPHGTADCSKRGGWACGEGTPPGGSLTSTPTDRAAAQMADRKVRRQRCETRASLSPLCDAKEVSLHILYLDVLHQRSMGGKLWHGVLLKDERSGDGAATSLINGRALELQLPVIWTCHQYQHVITFILMDCALRPPGQARKSHDGVAGRPIYVARKQPWNN